MQQVYLPRLSPKTHQTFAIEGMLSGRYANFDDQGLGKTKQCYDVAAKLFENGSIDLAIFVVKASLRETVLSETRSDAYQLHSIAVGGSKRSRFGIYNNLAHHVLVLSYETLVADQDVLRRLTSLNRTLLCFDESHYLKNFDSRRAQAALLLSELAVKTLTFSGTPIPNKMQDVFPQLKILGFDVGSSKEEFLWRFPTEGDLKKFLKDKFIRRTKTELRELKIPKKFVRKIRVKLNPVERRMYDDLAGKVATEFREKAEKTNSFSITHVLTRILRLHQIASNAKLLDDKYNEPSSKLIVLDRLVESATKRGKKIIIWTTYRKNVAMLLERYKRHSAVSLHGGLNAQTRRRNADEFKTNLNTKILVAIPACAREGFTLTSSHVAIYLDRSFSYLDWAQSQDRIHRISQTKKCEIIILEAENTIDERVDEIIKRKQQLQAYLLGEDTKYVPSILTIEEVMGLISPKGFSKHS